MLGQIDRKKQEIEALNKTIAELTKDMVKTLDAALVTTIRWDSAMGHQEYELGKSRVLKKCEKILAG